MKATEIREMSKVDRQAKLLELKREQFNLRFQVVTGELNVTSRVREVRRDIARLKTIISSDAIAVEGK